MEELHAKHTRGVLEYASKKPRRRPWWGHCVIVAVLSFLQTAIVLLVEFYLAFESESGVRHPVIEKLYYFLASPVYWLHRLIKDPSTEQAVALLVTNGVIWGIGAYFLIRAAARRQEDRARINGAV